MPTQSTYSEAAKRARKLEELRQFVKAGARIVLPSTPTRKVVVRVPARMK